MFLMIQKQLCFNRVCYDSLFGSRDLRSCCHARPASRLRRVFEQSREHQGRRAPSRIVGIDEKCGLGPIPGKRQHACKVLDAGRDHDETIQAERDARAIR